MPVLRYGVDHSYEPLRYGVDHSYEPPSGRAAPHSLEQPVCSFTDSRLEWLYHPADWPDAEGECTEGAGGRVVVEPSQLELQPPAKKDFWRRTFYVPTMIKADAPGLLCTVPAGEEATLELTVRYSPREQFDQAGVLVWLDNSHWLKTGFEYVDGGCRLSTVCCNLFSDWSTQPWHGEPAARLRVHKLLQGSTLVVEVNSLGGAEQDWQFMRICHLSSRAADESLSSEEPEAAGSRQEKPWRIGPFAACSIAQRGCVAQFSDLWIGPRKPMTHEAEGNDFGSA